MWGTLPVFAWRCWGKSPKPLVRIASLKENVWLWHLNMKHECYSHDCDVLYVYMSDSNVWSGAAENYTDIIKYCSWFMTIMCMFSCSQQLLPKNFPSLPDFTEINVCLLWWQSYEYICCPKQKLQTMLILWTFLEVSVQTILWQYY